jgi:hypothetical protein
MRARRVGPGPEFRLFQGEREIGRIEGPTVSFRGFASRDDAAIAASVAHLALTRRRLVMDHGSSQAVIAPAGVPAILLPPAAEGSQAGGWGFEIRLLPEEGVEIFAIAPARVMWHALRNAGVYRRMQRFRASHPADVQVTSQINLASRVHRAVS